MKKIILLIVLSVLNTTAFAESLRVDSLPAPYRHLLSQELMTKTLEQYYQRTAIIQPLNTSQNESEQTYSRTIIMLIDSNKGRNDAKLAERRQEAQIVELAFITINFKILPKDMIDEIRHTTVPFGTLLARHKIPFYTSRRSYFSLPCDEKLAAMIPCQLHHQTYGRKNVIVRKDGQWLAKVVEILP